MPEENERGDVIKCRAKISPDCYDGRPVTTSLYPDGMEDDGLWDGETVICDACYMLMGQPSVDVRQGSDEAVRHADDQLARLREFTGDEELEVERDLNHYRMIVDAALENGTQTAQVEFTLGELMLYHTLLQVFGLEIVPNQPKWIDLMDTNMTRMKGVGPE